MNKSGRIAYSRTLAISAFCRPRPDLLYGMPRGRCASAARDTARIVSVGGRDVLRHVNIIYNGPPAMDAIRRRTASTAN